MAKHLPPPAVEAKDSPTRAASQEPHASLGSRWGASAARLRYAFSPARTRILLGIDSRLIAVAVVLLSVLIIIGLVAAVVQKANNDAAFARRDAANYTPPPVAEVGSLAAPTVAVVGDQTVTGSGAGTEGRWPALLGGDLNGTVRTFASGGAGYTKTGADGKTFLQQVSAIPSKANVVVFFGGLNDAGTPPLDVAKAATRAFAEARSQAPDAKLIVVGPVVGAGASPAEVRNLRDALRSSARIVRATWIDPLDEQWLAGAASTRPSALSVVDERTISGNLLKAVRSALK